MKLPTVLLAIGHGVFCYTHLADPAGAIEQMVSAKSSEPVSEHCIAIIGALHLFVAVLFLMCSMMSDAGMRKCVAGIYLITFVPVGVAVQYMYPATGTPPATLTDMPLPIMYVFSGLALLAVMFGGSSGAKAKAA